MKARHKRRRRAARQARGLVRNRALAAETLREMASTILDVPSRDLFVTTQTYGGRFAGCVCLVDGHSQYWEWQTVERFDTTTSALTAAHDVAELLRDPLACVSLATSSAPTPHVDRKDLHG